MKRSRVAIEDPADDKLAQEIADVRKGLEALQGREQQVPGPHAIQRHALDPQRRQEQRGQDAMDQLREQRKRWEAGP